MVLNETNGGREPCHDGRESGCFIGMVSHFLWTIKKMDFTLDQLTSPFFPFSFSLDNVEWTSVAEYAYVTSLPCVEKRKKLQALFAVNTLSPRPWNTMELHHHYMQLLHACFLEWLLAEMDHYWTHAFNTNDEVRQRLVDTGTAILIVPEVEGAANLLMMHRRNLTMPIEHLHEKAKVLHFLTLDFLRQPRMADQSYAHLVEKYRGFSVAQPNMEDPILLHPNQMVRLLKKRHYPMMRQDQLKELNNVTARLMFAHSLKMADKSQSTTLHLVKRVTDEEAQITGKELLTSLRHLIPQGIMKEVEALERHLISEDDLHELETMPFDQEDPLFCQDMSIDVAPSLVAMMQKVTLAENLNNITLHIGDPLLPSCSSLKGMMEHILKKTASSSSHYQPLLKEWEEGFGALHHHVNDVMMKAFDRASAVKWAIPSFRAFLAKSRQHLFPFKSGFPWAGHLIERHLRHIHTPLPLPSAAAIRAFEKTPCLWNTALFLQDPLLRAFLRLKTSWMAQIFSLYLPKDCMGRRLPNLMRHLHTEEDVLGAILCPMTKKHDPNPTLLAYLQKFALGYDALAIFKVFDFFLSSLTSLSTQRAWCMHIIRCTFLLGSNMHLDDITSKLGIDFLYRHPYIVPAFTLLPPPRQQKMAHGEKWSTFNWEKFWRTSSPAVRSFIVCMAFAENATNVQKLKTDSRFITLSAA